MSDQSIWLPQSSPVYGGPGGVLCANCNHEVPPFTWHVCGYAMDVNPATQCQDCGLIYAIAGPPHFCPLAAPRSQQMPVIGYRGWSMVEDPWQGSMRLHSLGMNYVWEPGPLAAQCYAQGDPEDGLCSLTSRPVPEVRCGCGFWVLADWDQLQKHVRLHDAIAVGAVMGWGQVIRHGNEGWRAQFVQPLALADFKMSELNNGWVQAVAKQYNLPILEPDALQMMVREYGDPIAKESKTS